MVHLDGRSVGRVEADPRHHAQRMHDALHKVGDRRLRSATLPDAGGIPTAFFTSTPEHDLAARDQCWHPAVRRQRRRRADESDFYPTVIGSTGVAL